MGFFKLHWLPESARSVQPNMPEDGLARGTHLYDLLQRKLGMALQLRWKDLPKQKPFREDNREEEEQQQQQEGKKEIDKLITTVKYKG